MNSIAPVCDACAAIAAEHPSEKGCIVVNLADYQRLWDEIPSELKPFRMISAYGAKGITVKDKMVIQRDEYEGPPRWVPVEEVEQWSL